jgi:carbamoyltransferase
MAKKHTYILGINAYDHDCSACLLRDGEIAFAIAKERITRVKHATGFYQTPVDYCLNAEGIGLNDVDLVVRNCYVLPVHEMEQRLAHQDFPSYLSDRERIQAASNPLYLSKSNNVVTVSHHLAHAHSAFAACPFNEGAVMVVDGVGSYSADVTEAYPATDKTSPLARESESYYQFSGSNIETLKKVWLEPTRGFLSDEFYSMAGLGALYSRVSSYVFGDWNKCGELMGLAPYGQPDRVPPLMEIKNGELKVPDWNEEYNQPWLIDNGKDWEASPAMQHWKDLAWRTQDDTERVLLERARWLRETTGAKNLCIAGGVALNCVANGRIVRESGFDNVWIQPAAGDDGIAIGCAYYGHLQLQKKPRSYILTNAYFGRRYQDDEIAKITGSRLIRMVTVATPSRSVCADTAKVLSDGNVVGWFQDRSEFGPRALGNRSILADPRKAEMKDILNKRVKHRQAFRPFAPIIMAERVNEVFECRTDSPFMLIAAQVRPEWRDKVPAIVHVDGTARLQTVRREDNERLYDLLKEFDAITGVPVLLNTSFNVKGEPIVETPNDAMECFLTTGIDRLVLHDLIIAKTRFHKILAPIMGVYADVRTIVQSSMNAA